MAVLAYICTPVYHCYLPWPLTDRDHGMFIKVSHLQCQAYGSYQLHPIFIWGHSSVTHSFVTIFLCISLLPLLRPISISPFNRRPPSVLLTAVEPKESSAIVLCWDYYQGYCFNSVLDVVWKHRVCSGSWVECKTCHFEGLEKHLKYHRVEIKRWKSLILLWLTLPIRQR